VTTKNPKDDDCAGGAELFNGTMELFAAFIAEGISNSTLAKPKWRFHLSDGDFRRRKEWNTYGFLTFNLPDGRSGTVVAGVSSPSSPRYAFDGSVRVLAENMELDDLPNVVGDLVNDLMVQLGLAKRSRL